MTTPRIRLVPIGIDTWRVVHDDLGPIGQVRAGWDEQGEHYAVKRFHPRDRRFHVLGRFWNKDDAIDALVLST
ncbi:hypothetical protein [Microbacterium sp. bgisy207]|jgi:hypothetical protein|uniref:hypothetical protein n=1 Tax=Microbacterium sp. bgisy207 TaxID=3413800 RepID=UPI003EB9215E